MHDIELPFRSESGAIVDESRRDTPVRRQGREKEDHAQRIVDVAHCIYEGRIPTSILEIRGYLGTRKRRGAPLLDNVVQTIHRLVLL